MSISRVEGSRVYITRRIPSVGVELLKSAGCVVTQWDSDDVISKEELMKNVGGIDALLCLLTDRIDDEVLEAAGPQLKTVCTMSVGYDHLDIVAMEKRGVKVGSIVDISVDVVAELGVALLLAVCRRLFEAHAAVREGQWPPWTPLWMCGRGLSGSTVGLVGLGKIGMSTAVRLKAFEPARILYMDCVEKDRATELGAVRVSFNELLAECDFVFVSCPLTDGTRGLLNAEAFRKMKTSAVLINVSRGAVVNQHDLYVALKNGEIGGAGLDVTTPEPLPSNHELLSLSNCIVLPHIGSATVEARDDMARLTAQNVISALSGGKLNIC